jgi:hypothetical protein
VAVSVDMAAHNGCSNHNANSSFQVPRRPARLQCHHTKVLASAVWIGQEVLCAILAIEKGLADTSDTQGYLETVICTIIGHNDNTGFSLSSSVQCD